MAITNVEILRRAQVAIETTRGTAISVMTRNLYLIQGGLSWTYERELDSVKEQTRSYHATQDQQLGLSYCRFTVEANLTYEEVVWWLNTALDGNNRSGTQVGIETPAAYGYPLTPQSATDDLDTFTMKAGDGAIAYKFKRLAVNRLTIRFNPQQGGDVLWRMTAEIFALFDSAGVTFDTPTDQTRTKILARGTKVYIDEPAGTIGTTQVTGRVRSGEITIDNQIEEKVFAENVDTAHTDFARGEQLITGSLVLEHNNDNEFDDYRAGTVRKIRFEQTGAAINTATNYRARVDVPVAKYMSWSEGQAGANRIMTLGFIGERNATNTVPITVEARNALATITA